MTVKIASSLTTIVSVHVIDCRWMHGAIHFNDYQLPIVFLNAASPTYKPLLSVPLWYQDIYIYVFILVLSIEVFIIVAQYTTFEIFQTHLVCPCWCMYFFLYEMHHTICFPCRRMYFLSYLLGLHTYVWHSRYYIHAQVWHFLSMLVVVSPHACNFFAFHADVWNVFSFHADVWNVVPFHADLWNVVSFHADVWNVFSFPADVWNIVTFHTDIWNVFTCLSDVWNFSNINFVLQNIFILCPY